MYQLLTFDCFIYLNLLVFFLMTGQQVEVIIRPEPEIFTIYVPR